MTTRAAIRTAWRRALPGLAMLAAAAALSGGALAQHQHAQGAASDVRTLVEMPEPMRIHALANMRDHLESLRQINDALARNAFDEAARIAEQRLGMSSLDAHGAADLAPFLPEGMQDIGSQMHRAASRFGVAAQNASVANDARPALAALGEVMQQCVGCHAAYRFR